MARTKKGEMDITGDGVFDEKDKSKAASILASNYDESEEEVSEQKSEKKSKQKKDKYVAKKNINLKYREGDIVPEEQVMRWKEQGINYQVWFE